MSKVAEKLELAKELGLTGYVTSRMTKKAWDDGKVYE